MALPFVLPAVSRGHAELTSAARRLGAEVAEAAAASLSALVGAEVSVTGRAVPGRAWPRPAVARIALDLPALPGTAILEVEPALVVRVVDRMAGGDGAPAPAASLTPVEATALELLALAALDGACGVAELEERLSPRLARADAEPAGALAVELEVTAGPARGRARLLLPPAAVRALRGPAELDRQLPVPGSVRRGRAALTAAELDALEPGDVLVVDPPADGRDALVLPGGLRALGRIDGEGFHVEETEMAERHAQLPVTLEVELARVDVPLAEVARLEPGSVLALNLDRRGLVTLRLGERAVARGELVDVEGAVGVRILSLEVAP
ncbi:type III secretion system apparatus protein YscQ/HrcQ [Anaeromyxobacter sp. K]|uniref:FliM/FliN family flagellar motor switch protein n=1 Tax=Anaeromyxobacter sp. (strain K) TaxID=447217 RepID=UPI00015F8E71|nr:FliM/FliN family flagellar motor switch protein [Anaeromyxobacter sp. K]ACG71979.1 type III secretion system apparatus protein YscQ/HrcQ [Anaeromyxobacter sp. K]